MAEPRPELTGAPSGPFWRRDWFCALLLVLATLAAYQHVWSAGFIWDDDMHLTQNPCIVGPLGLSDIWTTPAARYFPLVLTSFWVEHAIWGLHPLPYHVVNVLLHAACALALWRVLLGLRIRGAMLGAALWALHPVQVESVAWITELKNTQSGLFYLLSVLYFVKWLTGGLEPENRVPRHYALAVLFAALAMASKSSTVVLPLVLALCAWWATGSLGWRTVARLAPLFLLSCAAGALSLWTQHLEGANAPEWNLRILERAAVAGRDFWFYLGKLAWPHPLVFIYPRWAIDTSDAMSYGATAAMVALFGFLWWRRNGVLRPAFFALAYFLFALLPVLGLFDQYFWRYSFVGDHFQYLASMGPLALAGAAIAAASDALGAARSAARHVVGAGLPAVLALLSWRHCEAFESEEALWRSTVALNPGCWMAYNDLGSLDLEAGRADVAAVEFSRAIEARPADVEAHYNLGFALARTGRLDEAMAQDRRALEIDPGFERAHNALGDALLQQGRPDEAIPEFQAALRIRPKYAAAENNFGNALLAKGRVDEAIAHYRRAIEIEPGNAEAHSNLGSALQRLGRDDEAAIQLERALEINPSFATALVNLGNVRLHAGRPDDAAALYVRALRAAPDLAEAHNNLGYVLMGAGRLDEAIAHFRRALQIHPGYPEAHRNLGTALFRKGSVGEADAEFQAASRGR